jgi:amino acid adenylation domain-containing protein
MSDLVSTIATTAGRYPSLPALQSVSGVLSYGGLWSAAGRVAVALTGEGNGPERVGLYLMDGNPTLVAWLGIIRAGHSVVPISPQSPAARNAAIVSDAGVRRILYDESRGDPATAGPDATLIPIGEVDGSGRLPDITVRPEDIAYTIFTSGSTGRPKAVPITHRNITEFTVAMVRRYGMGPGDRVAQTCDMTFDMSLFGLVAPWISGGTAVVSSRQEFRNPVRFLRDNRITHVMSVPSVIALAERIRTLTDGCLPDLRWSLFGGEALSYAKAAAWRRAASAGTVENVYGPTETTLACAAYRLPADPAEWPATSNDTVPIGRVFDHLESVVLNDERHPDSTGELCVRGSQRFPGYLDETDNANRFFRQTADGFTVLAAGPVVASDWYRTGDRVRSENGELVYLGRVDRQTKVRGYRIELDEVESVLRRHPKVTDTAVIVAEDQLRAFYTGEAVESRELMAFMGTLVPPYMVPASLRHLTAFPLNTSGKVDRSALRSALQRGRE